MTTTATRFAARSVAALLAAAATAGLAGTAAYAAPVAPVAPAAPAAAAEQSPQFWADGVNLNFVNKTDMTFTYTSDHGRTSHTVRPGETAQVPANEETSRYVDVSPADKSVFLCAGAHNHGLGTPNAYGLISTGGQSVERKEHQGVNEHDTLVSLGGFTLHSYRGADHNGKNFTITVDKAGAAQATADNSTSTRNTFVYTNGAMVPVAKGTKAAVGQLERGKDSLVQFSRGGVPAEVKVSWVNHVAQFSGHGTTAALANGESANFGYVTVTRADAGTTTAYTYTFR